MGRSGRPGLGHRVYRRNRAQILARSSICGICGHPGATTADHIIDAKRWAEMGLPPKEFDGLDNLQPAHGTMGNKLPPNRCPICNRLCNQSKGNRSTAASGRRPW